MADNLSIFNFDRQRSVHYFFSKLLIFILIIAVLDLFIGEAIRYLYFSQTSGSYERVTYSLEKTKEDLLVFGSSRANHHYVPDIFSNRLGLAFYCVGEDGQGIFYNLSVLKSILKRYTPKIIILDFTLTDFNVGKDSYDRLSMLMPYYNTHPEIRDVLLLKSKFEKIKMISHIYPFNSEIFTIISRNLPTSKHRKVDDKGYIPLFKEMGASVREKDFEDQKFDEQKIRAFDDFLRLASKGMSKTFVVISPYYLKIKGKDRVLLRVKEIAQKYKVRVIDYSQEERFVSHPEYFQDELHLNNSGAQIFSRFLSPNIQAAL